MVRRVENICAQRDKLNIERESHYIFLWVNDSWLMIVRVAYHLTQISISIREILFKPIVKKYLN